MIRFASSLVAVVLAITPFVTAQTFSECDPTKKTGCAPNPGLNQTEYTIDFTKEATKAGQDFKTTNGQVDYTGDGAVFSIKQTTDGPTIQSNFYIMFGYVEVKMKSSPSAGIVSSFVLESDDLDEMDWEMIGSQTTQVQSNYFGKGNTTTYDRGQFHPVTTPAETVHTYAIDWNKDTTKWIIDGQVVRTLNFADAVGGSNYPQTPMNIRLGNWVGGRPENAKGTIEWAGGLADMSKAPFNMYVQSVTIKNYNPAASYTYGDQTGNWQSIKMGTEPVSNARSSAVPQVSPSAGAGVGSSGPGTVTINPAGNVAAKSTTCTEKGTQTGTSNSNTGGKHGGSGNSAFGQGSSHGGKGTGQGSGTGRKSTTCTDKTGRTPATGLAGNVAPPPAGKPVTISPAGAQATGLATNGTGQSFSNGPMGNSGNSGSSGESNGSSGQPGSGIVQDGPASNGTQPTVTFNVGSGVSAQTANAGSGTNPSGMSTFALGGNGTASARPAQVTTNGAVSRKMGSSGALAVLLVLVVVLL